MFGRGALGMSHAARIGQLRPLAWAAIAALSGTVLLTAGVFAARPKSERPGGIAPAAETQQVETSEIPPRPVHTVLVGPPESADPASTEASQVFVQGRPVSQSDIERTRASLEQGLRDLRTRPGEEPNATFDFATWTGSTPDRSEPSGDSSQDQPPTAANQEPQKAASAEAGQPSKQVANPAAVPDQPKAGPRVAIHWPTHDGKSAELAKDLAKGLERQGWTVAALKPVSRSVRHVEIRYPKRSAHSSAVQVRSELMKSFGEGGGRHRILLSHRHTAEDATIEIWLRKSPSQARKAAPGGTRAASDKAQGSAVSKPKRRQSLMASLRRGRRVRSSEGMPGTIVPVPGTYQGGIVQVYPVQPVQGAVPAPSGANVQHTPSPISPLLSRPVGQTDGQGQAPASPPGYYVPQQRYTQQQPVYYPPQIIPQQNVYSQ